MTRVATATANAAPVPRADWLDRLDPAVADLLDGGMAGDPERLTRRLALGHYENFSVASLALPRRLRQDFCNVYAFCRAADDLGDELGNRELSLRRLAELRGQTEACFAGRPGPPLFVALRRSIDRHDLPIRQFLDLIDAFEQDQRVDRYETDAQLLDYCRRSANPVGRLVLAMCGHRDSERQRLSDLTCTALQLTNFWQDVRRDLHERGRLYIPAQTMRAFGLDETGLRRMIDDGRAGGRYREMVRAEVARASALFEEGAALLPMLDRSVRRQVGLFADGGRATLRAIAAAGFDTLARRPALSRWSKARLVIGAMLPRWGTRDAAASDSENRRRVADPLPFASRPEDDAVQDRIMTTAAARPAAPRGQERA